MSGIEVLEIVIRQIGDLRVPMKEKGLRDSLDVIVENLCVLKEAMENVKRNSGQSKFKR